MAKNFWQLDICCTVPQWSLTFKKSAFMFSSYCVDVQALLDEVSIKPFTFLYLKEIVKDMHGT